MLNYVKNNPIAGIYAYINNNTGALYIGSAKNIWERHLIHLRPSDIDIAIANEGFENFTFKVLEAFPIGTDKKILRQNERKWIDRFDAENDPLHYNKPHSGGDSTKYNMWDPSKVHYNKNDMFKNGNEKGLNVRRCFTVSPTKFGGKRYHLPIGRFNEFVSPTIIYDLSQQWS